MNNTAQYMLAAHEYESKVKSKGVAYVLWFLFGGLGIHRFYTGDVLYGILMLIVNITLASVTFGLGWIAWWIIDAFLLSGRIDRINREAMLRFNVYAEGGNPNRPL